MTTLSGAIMDVPGIDRLGPYVKVHTFLGIHVILWYSLIQSFTAVNSSIRLGLGIFGINYSISKCFRSYH